MDHIGQKLLLRFRESKTIVINGPLLICGLVVLLYRALHGSMLRMLAFITVIIVLSACATPYQKAGFKGGYTDFETQPGIYYVSFKGNTHISKETVILYWHQRAAEICGGRERYEVLSQDSSVTPYISGGSSGVSTEYKARAEGYIRCKQTTVPTDVAGEWIMWSKVIDTAGGDIMWDANNTFSSNSTCQEAAEKASSAFEELAKTWPDKIKQLLGRGNKIQNVRRIGTTVLFEVDGALINAGYTCFPVTIDPRKKK